MTDKQLSQYEVMEAFERHRKASSVADVIAG